MEEMEKKIDKMNETEKNGTQKNERGMEPGHGPIPGMGPRPGGRPQFPDYYVAPPIYDENGNKIEYGKNGCPKGRDLSQFNCPCNFPKCVYIKGNAEAFERMQKERQEREKEQGIK